MKLLLIEDDSHFAAAITKSLEENGLRVSVAGSKDSALSELGDTDFDFIICDLKIPDTDKSLDAEIQHGIAVYRHLSTRSFGIPVLVLSGHRTSEFLDEVVDSARQDDPFGNGENRPMIRTMHKKDLKRCLEYVFACADEVRALNNIEIATGISSVQLTANQRRVLRVFSRRQEGVIVRVQELGGGLTESKTLRLKIENAQGQLKATAVAKLTTLEAMEDERSRFDAVAPGRLPNHVYPSLAGTVRAGGGPDGGLFYALAEDYVPLFQVLLQDPLRGPDIVAKLRDATANWREATTQSASEIKGLRQNLLSDERLQTLEPPVSQRDLESYEQKTIWIRSCTAHRDMHGLNILVNDENQPVLIDFGSAGLASSALDPITLELSILFHPSATELRSAWPSHGSLESWANLERFLEDCPFSSFITACREWAHDVAAGDNEVYATAYGYSLRQMQYSDTNHDWALKLTRAAQAATQA